MKPPRRAARLLWPLLLAAAVAAFYLLTLWPGIGGETDTAKWQFLCKAWGVPHTTGYPLYVSLGHLFSQIPLGGIAWRMNLMSAFFAVLAVVLAQRILAGIARSEALACAGAILLAVSPLFWRFAVVAGVYSLNAFFVCLVIYFLFKWHDRRHAGTKGMGYFYAAFAAYALSFGNHVTMITMLPALVLFALLTDRRAVLRPKTLLIVFAFFAIAALQYAVPFIQTARGSPFLENRVNNLGDLWRLLTATGFREYMFSGGAGGFERMAMGYTRSVAAQFTFFGFLFIFAGALFLFFRSRAKFAFLLAFLAVNLFFALNYFIPQAVYQFIPSYVALALFIGLVPAAGLLFSGGKGARAAASILLAAAILAMAGYTALSSLPKFEVKMDEAKWNDRLISDIVDALPPGGVILASDYSDSMMFFYKMLGEERGREKQWRVLHDTSWKVAGLAPVENLLEGKPVDWGPLAMKDEYQGRRAIFFSEADKALLERAGFTFEQVDLPGDGSGKNVYRGETKRIYRITGRRLRH